MLERSLKQIENKIDRLEGNLARIEEKLDFSLSLLKNQLIRIKNSEDLSDEIILLGQPYNDLDPQSAYRIFENKTANFLVLDVSSANNRHLGKIENAIDIPLEELPARWQEIPSKTVPILVISEDGTHSILACEYLVQKGYFNLNNISGGHSFWPGHKTSTPENAKLKIAHRF